MSVAIYPVIEGGDADAAEVCGKTLATHHDEIWSRIQHAGLRPLYDFLVLDEAELEAFGIDGDAAETEHWFDPSDGLVTLAAIRQCVVSDGVFAKVASLLEDIDAFQAILQRAADKGNRWHLGIDY